MLTFYRTPNCNGCAAIQEVLENLAIPHETVVLQSPEDLPANLAASAPPVLVDEHKVFQGQKNILAHLEELEDFKELWYKFQSDACYCDAEGNIE